MSHVSERKGQGSHGKDRSFGPHHIVSKVSQHGCDGGDPNSPGNEQQRTPDVTVRQKEIPTNLELHSCTWALLHMPALLLENGLHKPILIAEGQLSRQAPDYVPIWQVGSWIA